ncbi:EbsA family protein [Streptococcus sp. DD13]|uniref:EbsA family protein n=1 Tax=Streptococcus sp. DD13 TaxID=1777881 RepID=UPI00079351D0|nr:EbsA family protein [Streptococcus sp. DD13]KXT79159.1 Pore forming protein ebsA [Streptococcus sp. DD13]
MIKIFGKYRYHWQPELAWSMIYWCLTLMMLFIPLAIFFEISYISTTIQQFLLAFLVLVMLGVHRYFVIKDDELQISTANPFKTTKIPVSSIHKVEVRKQNVTIFSTDYPDGMIYRMRKWPKKYFINALTLTDSFQGEIELSDGKEFDYFSAYYLK